MIKQLIAWAILAIVISTIIYGIRQDNKKMKECETTHQNCEQHLCKAENTRIPFAKGQYLDQYILCLLTNKTTWKH